MSRRKLLTMIAVSGLSAVSVPDRWVKPVVKTTLLPAHADCSGDECDSDLRLKENVEPLVRTEQGIQLYRFEYLTDTVRQTYVGVMAQDLEESHPEALRRRADGYYRVDYSQLGLKMATWEEWQDLGIEAATVH